MKFRLPRPLYLLIGLFAGLAAGCAPRPPASTGPTARETELMKTVEELRGQLAAAEQAAAQAKAEAASALALVPPAPIPATQTTATPTSPAADTPVTDTRYIVVKKSMTVGQLISKATAANPNLTERRPAQYHITFKGAQSGKEYPALEVQELAYSRFREGVAYSPQDLNEAKKPVATAGGSATTRAGSTGATGSSNPIDPELRALFGN